MEDPRLLVGAGAVELELSRQLKAYADEVMGLDQYAIRKFAEVSTPMFASLYHAYS